MGTEQTNRNGLTSKIKPAGGSRIQDSVGANDYTKLAIPPFFLFFFSPGESLQHFGNYNLKKKNLKSELKGALTIGEY